ncbi:MAG: hypothetical protein ABR555_15355 [Pyrinomonadaceae bacterium]
MKVERGRAPLDPFLTCELVSVDASGGRVSSLLHFTHLLASAHRRITQFCG